jgi:hypothetical protein
MHDTVMKRNLRHAMTWFILATVGICTLIGLRHVGQTVRTRSETEAALADIWDEYQRGEVIEAQKQLYGFVIGHPTMRSQILEKFGPHMMGMPRVFELFNSKEWINAPDTAYGSNLTDEVVVAIWSGNAARASEQLDESAADTEISPFLLLWRAREAFRIGDLKNAESWFSRYWQVHSQQRHHRVTQVFENRLAVSNTSSDNLAEQVYTLLWDGLWAEAFEAAGSVKERTYPVMLCDALQADLRGDAAAALRSYRDVLSNHPGDYIASVRAQALQR